MKYGSSEYQVIVVALQSSMPDPIFSSAYNQWASTVLEFESKLRRRWPHFDTAQFLIDTGLKKDPADKQGKV